MSNSTIEIDGVYIGRDHAPYIIAELSGNHNGSLDRALELVTIARQSGASAVKIQTYTADTITLKCDKEDFKIEDGPWAGKTLYELYQWAHTPWDWHKQLFDHARRLGVTMFSSPFDTTAVDLLEDLNTPAYKIASFEAVDLPLIKYVAGTSKPMIISTGMADQQEIAEAIQSARDGGCSQLAILHCVSGYPAPAADYNLRTLLDMQDRYGLVTGLSDHTLGIATSVAAIALGASVVEKHLTLDRSAGGPDDAFSLEPHELADLVSSAKTAWAALGEVNYRRKSSEGQNVKFRRSLYFVADMKAGQTIEDIHVRSIRPGYGLAPKMIDEVIGRKTTRAISRGSPVKIADYR